VVLTHDTLHIIILFLFELNGFSSGSRNDFFCAQTYDPEFPGLSSGRPCCTAEEAGQKTAITKAVAREAHTILSASQPLLRISRNKIAHLWRMIDRIDQQQKIFPFPLRPFMRHGSKAGPSAIPNPQLPEALMAGLKGTKTEENLKAAFAGESQANRRYLYFAQKADVEGYNDIAAVFRSTAEGETGHAHGHLEFLEEVGDPATGEPIGETSLNLKASIAGETHEYTDMYPGMARSARDEGFDEIADWFETLAKAEKSHAGRFQKALDSMNA
jgi:rubrerythrin